MEYIQSIILGIVQGLTEFLPVSSSGHLVVFPSLIGVKTELLNSMSFDVFLHGGTLVGVVYFFRKKIWEILEAFFRGLGNSSVRKENDFKMGIYIIAGTIPAVIVALFFKDVIEEVFRSPLLVAINLILFGVILYISDLKSKKEGVLADFTMKAAVVIGVFQVLALMPGVSRSGITITAALMLGYKREDSAEFSFLLSIPAIAGAFIFTMPDLIKAGINENLLLLAVGFAASAVSGFLAIKILLDFVKKHSFLAFAVYRLLFGAVIIALFLRG